MGKKRIPSNIFKTPLYWSMKAPEIILYTAIVNQEPGTVNELQEIAGMSKKTTQAGVRKLVDLGLVTSRRDYKRQEMILQLVESERPTGFITVEKTSFNATVSNDLTPDEFKFVLLLKYLAGGSGKIVTTKSKLSIASGIGPDAIERYIRDLSLMQLLRYKYSNGELKISVDLDKGEELMTKEEKAKAARKAYMQKYRKENRERLNEKRREWYENNKEYARKYHSIYNKRNRERIQEKATDNWSKKYEELKGKQAMANKIKTDKLKQGIENLLTNVEHAAAEVEKIKSDWQLSPEYKDDQLEKAQEKYKAAIKELTDGMKNQIQSDVSAAVVTRSVDYAAETYHATTVKQEIEGLNTKQLLDRYADIVAEGDTSRKKQFERLAAATMKNNGDVTEAAVFQRQVYENMSEPERDEIDTRNAADKYLYNVGIIERQADVLLQDVLDGRQADAAGLLTIWEEGAKNAEGNLYV